MLDREPRPGPCEPRLDLVGDEDDAVVGAPRGERGQETWCGHHEAALALDGLDEHAREIACSDLHGELVDRAGGRLLAGHPFGVAQRVRHRGTVDLGSERAEMVLVGEVLGGQRHRQVRAAVVRVVEHRDRLTARRMAGDLDGVLDRLGARVEQRGALLVVAGRHPRELFADGHVAFVRRHHEAGVREARHLLAHRVHERRARVAHGRHGDAGPEVDQAVPVDITHDRARGVLDVHPGR